jgi:3-methyladenine DNA glycosylase AlkD
VKATVDSVLARLTELSSEATRKGMSRFGIPSDHAVGVTMKDLKTMAKELGRNHDLAIALWATEIYEARMLTSMIADPALVTPEQMESWCGQFDNWAICDTMCFNLFDRTKYAWEKAAEWSARPEEFVKRTGFALYWSLTVHDRTAPDCRFLDALAAIEREAHDNRHYVKKAVDMALRAAGKRKPALRAGALELARRLAASSAPSASFIGRSALKELGGRPAGKRAEV